MRVRVWALGGLVVALLTACTSAPAAPPSARTGSPTAASDRCGTSGNHLRLSTVDGVSLDAIEIGSGRRGVLLVPELGRVGMCGWSQYGAYLAERGLHVLLFDHRCTGASACPAAASNINGLLMDIDAGVKKLRSDGATGVALLGASQGAAEVIIAAAGAPSGITGIVALSADELTQPLAGPPHPSTASRAAPLIHLPTFIAVSAGDPYVSAADTRALEAAMPAVDKDLEVVAGSSAHGWDLVTAGANGTRPPLSDTLVAFLTRVTTPDPLTADGCPTTMPMHVLAAGSLDVAMLGTTGPVAILANQSDENLCSWLPFAVQLVAAGYRAMLWDYGGEPVGDISAILTALRGSAAHAVTLIGASKGAKASLIAAASKEPYVNGVVALSPEATLAPGIDVAASVRTLHAPTLLITASDDQYGAAEACPAILAAISGRDKQLVTIAGSDHGTALLTGASATRVLTAMMAFLHRIAPSA